MNNTLYEQNPAIPLLGPRYTLTENTLTKHSLLGNTEIDLESIIALEPTFNKNNNVTLKIYTEDDNEQTIFRGVHKDLFTTLQNEFNVELTEG